MPEWPPPEPPRTLPCGQRVDVVASAPHRGFGPERPGVQGSAFAGPRVPPAGRERHGIAGIAHHRGRRRVRNGARHRRDACRARAARSRSSIGRARRAPKSRPRSAASFHPCDVTDFDGHRGRDRRRGRPRSAALHFVVNTAGGGIAQRTLTQGGPASRSTTFRQVDRPEPGRDVQRQPALARST